MALPLTTSACVFRPCRTIQHSIGGLAAPGGPPRPLPTLLLTVKLSNLDANSVTNLSLKLLNAAVKSGWSGG
ncbi:hypothetical protein OUZ56_033329 [Daphnia magna]|uniref:Uncharacterized protein n=1 Tax=Daphnia magna TaxID=35525 RepID=A0ABR0BAY8_9CRUS|nr:hypothetical protein OUZ56_033329 [Daphnia magna]